MHINVYQAVRPPGCPVILIKSLTILQRSLPKPHYFDAPRLKPKLTRCRKKLVIRKDYQLKVSVFLVT